MQAVVKRKKKRLSVKNKIIILVLIIIVSLGLICYTVFQYLFGGLTQKEITKDFGELGIDSSRFDLTKDTGIVNIALYGIDSRTNSNKGLSDAIMVATFDIENGYIKITSIARDTYVAIDGYENSKINEAYSHGGAVLAIKTLNQNFNLDIQDYVTVNFNQLANVIDSAGGATVNISEEERKAANEIMNELNRNDAKISKSGDVSLTGSQAVAYCRIRKLDSDNVRTQRQRNVLNALFNKAKTMSKVELANVVHDTMPMVETSLSYNKMLDMAKIFTNKNVEFKDMAFPNSTTKYATGNDAYINGKWFFMYDLEIASQQLFDFIYNDIKTE